ncbi:MAG: hypothetical protein LBT88_02185, partial [Oscillospiraceae bacterium]|nr:hypothetical protein [Oscillospiraceae bacterium]
MIINKLHEDTTFPSTYMAEHNGRPKIKTEMRGAIISMNRLLYAVWHAARTGTIDGSSLVLPSEYKVTKKVAAQLSYTGIEISDGKMYANEYQGMFRALKTLTLRLSDFAPPWGKFTEGLTAENMSEASVYTDG